MVVVAAIAFAVTQGGGGGGGGTFARLSPGTKTTGSNTDLSIEFQGAGNVTIGGDLLLPPGAGASTPGVVIVPDMGQTDRNGFSPTNEVADPLYSDLAQSLAHAGVASLRYDRRGQGQSMLPAGADIALTDVVGDARGAVTFLSGRADVDKSHLAVVGDGQGGLVALSLAAQDPSVKAVALVSTPGRPVVETMVDHVGSVASNPDFAQQLVTQLRSTVSAMVGGAAEPPPASLAGPLQPLFPPGESSFLRSLFTLSPGDLASAVHVPTLIVQGGLDPSLAPADAQALAQGLGADAQVMAVAGDGPTLEMSAGPTTTFPQPSLGAGVQSTMPALHSGLLNVATVRDDQTLTSIGSWLKAHS